MSSLQALKDLVVEPIDTVVFCRNKTKIILSPSLKPSVDNTKTDDWDGPYAGDVCPAAKTEHYPQYIQVRDGYQYAHTGHREITTCNTFVSLHDNKSTTNKPQILFIKPPISCNINYNYLHQLIKDIKLTYEAMMHSDRLTKELMYEILYFLPFKFPIFISCTSIHRGHGSWTHFTYPYTKSKDYMIQYIKKCGSTLDAIDGCEYEVEFYVMKDDVPLIPKDKWMDLADDYNVDIEYKYDANSSERVFNKSILVCRVRTQQLNNVIRVNEVGGSFWLNVHMPKDGKGVELMEENIKHLDLNVDTSSAFVYSEIGGSCGIKSRCWFQTLNILQGKYLPMTVVNVMCGTKLVHEVIHSI